jgi:hypothetical protein
MLTDHADFQESFCDVYAVHTAYFNREELDIQEENQKGHGKNGKGRYRSSAIKIIRRKSKMVPGGDGMV